MGWLGKVSEFVPCGRKIFRGPDPLPFDRRCWKSAPRLVGFPLHPAPHTGTRRRLFPCEKIRRFVSPGVAVFRSWRGTKMPACWPWWTCSNANRSLSNCKNFLRIDNHHIIVEPGHFLKSKSRSQWALKHLVSIVYDYSRQPAQVFVAVPTWREIRSLSHAAVGVRSASA